MGFESGVKREGAIDGDRGTYNERGDTACACSKLRSWNMYEAHGMI